MLYSKKLTEHCKPAIMKTKHIILKKKNSETMPFTTTWMDLEILILSKVRKINTI